MNEVPGGQGKDIQEGKFFALISYISFLCVLTLLLKKENKFALYHAKQGLIIFVGEVICFVLSVIPLLRALCAIVTVVFILSSIWGIILAAKGSYGRIPLVTEIAKKISL